MIIIIETPLQTSTELHAVGRYTVAYNLHGLECSSNKIWLDFADLYYY